MNRDRIRGRWKQWTGKIKEQWGRLTEDDLDVIAGRRDQLLGRIQERHGLARDEAADKQLDAQYAAARERCEMLPAEGRENCLLHARRRFGRI